MKNILRSSIGFIILGGLVFAVVTYSGMVKQAVGVKGVSTQIKAENVTKEITNDINKEIQSTASKAGEIKVSEIISVVQRLQQVPQDIAGVRSYIEEQLRIVISKADR